MIGKPLSKLRSLREQRGLRQFDLCVLARLSSATIWHAEHNDSICKKTRQKIAKALKVSVKDLWPDDSHEAKGRTGFPSEPGMSQPAAR
jgi:transcriptional regulator with XRE-family HTH domain